MGLSRIFQSLDLLLSLLLSMEGALEKDVDRIIKMDKKTQKNK